MQFYLVSSDVNDLSGYLFTLEMLNAICIFKERLLSKCGNLASIWAQHSFGMEAIWLQSGGFVRQQPNLSLNRRCGEKNWPSDPDLNAVWCGVSLVFRYIDGAGEVTWILQSVLSPVIPAVNGMKKNCGLCQSQWSSSVAERADRTRATASVFTQVCVAACQLLQNNIESRLKVKLYVQTWEGESVLYKNGSVYYFLKAIQGWALPKKQASLIVSALHSHTPTFPYLALRHFPQLRWFRYDGNYSKLGVSAQKRTQAAFTTYQEMFGIIWILAQSLESDWFYISPDLKIPSCSSD